MTEQKPGGNFLDSKTLIAIVMVAIFWFGWDQYMASKYPSYYEKKGKVQQTVETGDSSTPMNQGAKTGRAEVNAVDNSAEKVDEISDATTKKEILTSYRGELFSFKLSSKGMGLKEIRLNKFQGRDAEVKSFAPIAEHLPFETNLIGHRTALDFVIEQKSDVQFFGKATKNGMVVEKTLTIDPENYSFKTRINVSNRSDEFSGLVTYLAKKAEKAEKAPFFMPSFDRQEFFFEYDGEDTSRVMYSQSLEEDVNEVFSKAKVAAIGSQYFAVALLDKSGVIPDAKAFYNSVTDTAYAMLTHEALTKDDTYSVNFVGYAGPKSLKLLEGIDDKLAAVIDFGWFSSIAVYILAMMKMFYSLVGNWGIAIILLTILVRLIVLPINLASYKSMKKMQNIQPRLKEIREKYKDDKQRLNQETMTLMRDAKVNPLGGCLPMFIQIPVFIALYQVLAQSIELYQAPFALWIGDLSLKDQFYVLPVLMGVTMFLQQKITPNTLEPAQRRIMMILPVVFAFMMSTLPSGLTLYIFVSTLFGVVQQLVFMRPDGKSLVAAKA